MVLGTSISVHNGVVDWSEMAANNIKFAYIRASLGPEYKDPLFLYNVREASRNGIITGAYHYLTVEGYATDQINNFLADLTQESLILPPAIDVENVNITEKTIRTVLEGVEIHLDGRPIVYTSATKWPLKVDWASRYGLYVAHYEVDNPTLPYGWSEFDFHQFTQTADGPFYGAESSNITLERFNGTEDDLLWYTRRWGLEGIVPRVDYDRVTIIVPSNIPWENKNHIYKQAAENGTTITASFDAPEWGKAIIYGISEEDRYKYVNFYNRFYPEVVVEFRSL